MKKRNRPTYLSFLRQLTQINPDQATQHKQFDDFRLTQSLLQLSGDVLYILDYLTRQYTHMSASCQALLNYPPEAFYEGGVDFSLHIWHAKDAKLFSEQIFPENLTHFLSIPAQDLNQHRVCYTYRLQRTDKTYVSVLQQSTIISTSSTGIPLVTFGIVRPLPPTENTFRISHSIERLDEQHVWQPIYTHNYFPDVDEGDLLSKTEIEILKWILEGYSSQAIADKLHRSLHTIKTHRKNMLEKTNAKNTADLLRYAIRQGLI